MTQSIGNNFRRSVSIPPGDSNVIGNGTPSAGHVEAAHTGQIGTDPIIENLENMPNMREAAEQAEQNHPERDVNLEGAAAPGKTSFLDKIKGFFHRTPKTTVNLPPSIQLTMPDNGPKIDMKIGFFEQMLETKPKEEREAYAKNELATVINNRLENGHSKLNHIMSGGVYNVEPKEYKQDVADVTLYLCMLSAQKDQAIDRGAMSISDPQGRLANFLEHSPEKYQRSSSHLKGMQEREIDNHLNIHRGIDIETGPETGLLSDHKTIVFAPLAGDPAHNVGRRMWIKPENSGCRISTLSLPHNSSLRKAGMKNVDSPERPTRYQDLSSLKGHSWSFIKSKIVSKIALVPERKERIDKEITGAFSPIKNLVNGKTKEKYTNDPLKEQVNTKEMKKLLAGALTLGEMVRCVSDLKAICSQTNSPMATELLAKCNEFNAKADNWRVKNALDPIRFTFKNMERDYPNNKNMQILLKSIFGGRMSNNNLSVSDMLNLVNELKGFCATNNSELTTELLSQCEKFQANTDAQDMRANGNPSQQTRDVRYLEARLGNEVMLDI